MRPTRGVRLLALGLGLAALAGCSWFRGAPEAPVRLADRMRKDPVPYERLHEAAAKAPARNVLWLRERYLAELTLGATPEQVRRRWGEPTRVRQQGAHTWWEYDEVYPKPGATPAGSPTGERQPGGAAASDVTPDERREPVAARVGMNLRLLFVDVPVPAASPSTPAPEATPAPSMPTPVTRGAQPSSAAQPSPTSPGEEPAPIAEQAPAPAPTATPPQLAHVEAWAPARFQTRSLVRVLDLAARVERKYGKAPVVMPWGRDGGEVWLYPAANVGYVVTPAWEEQPRYVAGILMGFDSK